MRKLISAAHCRAFSVWLMNKDAIGHPREVLAYYTFRLLQDADRRWGTIALMGWAA